VANGVTPDSEADFPASSPELLLEAIIGPPDYGTRLNLYPSRSSALESAVRKWLESGELIVYLLNSISSYILNATA